MWRVSSILELNGLSTPKVRYEQSASERGTAIHRAAESLAEGYDPAIEKPEYAPFIKPLQQWFRERQPHVIATERRIVNRNKRSSGQIDLTAILEGARSRVQPYIIDFKTGVPQPWHGIQTAGYKDLAVDDDDLWQAMGEPFASLGVAGRDTALQRAILYLPGDGSYTFKPQDDPSDHWRFSSALGLLQWRHDHGLLTYTDEEVPADKAGIEPVIIGATF